MWDHFFQKNAEVGGLRSGGGESVEHLLHPVDFSTLVHLYIRRQLEGGLVVGRSVRGEECVHHDDGAAVVLMGQGYENGPLPDSLDGHFRTYARVHLSADENGKIHGPRAERLLKDGYRVLVTIPFCKVEDRAGLMLSLRRTGHMIIAMMCEAPDESWPLGDPFQKREAHYAFSKDCAKNVAVKDVIHLFDPQ